MQDLVLHQQLHHYLTLEIRLIQMKSRSRDLRRMRMMMRMDSSEEVKVDMLVLHMMKLGDQFPLDLRV